MVFFIVVGNSRIKVYQENNIDNPHIFEHKDVEKACKIANSKTYIASVVPHITQRLSEQIIDKEIIYNFDIPIEILTKNPDANGIDRTINSYFAHQLNPLTNNIIFDCGTALSVSVINAKGQELGGTISPGIKLNLKSLFSGAALLPDINNITAPNYYIGNDTLSAINNGIYWGAIGAIKEIAEGISSELKKQNGLDTLITLCGGWSQLISKRLNIKHMLEPHFTAKGLKHLYRKEII